MTKTARIAAISVLVGIVVLAVKTLAWWVTGSVALLSDALESIVNVATALAALIAAGIMGYFALAQALGALSLADLRASLRRRR